MKRIIINIFLLVVFTILIAAASWPLVTQVYFNKAKRLEISYRWSKARGEYLKAVELNPLNADYFAQAGDFFLRQSAYRKNEKELFQKAKELYLRACQLNPRYGYYRFLLGRTLLRLGDIKGAVDNFKIAVSLDPYNFRTNYLIGANILWAYHSLNEEEKDFALTRLRHAVEVRPHYLINVCQSLVYYARGFNALERVVPQDLKSYRSLYNFVLDNNLWQYRQVVLDKVNYYRVQEEPEDIAIERADRLKFFKQLKVSQVPVDNLIMPRDWQGVSKTGNNIFKDGNMYWSGTMNTVVNTPKGNTEISIQARGTPANGVFPYMIVELDGEAVGETAIDSQDWRQYSFMVNTDGGAKVLSITFANDGSNKLLREDRNLYIGETRIISNEQQSI